MYGVIVFWRRPYSWIFSGSADPSNVISTVSLGSYLISFVISSTVLLLSLFAYRIRHGEEALLIMSLVSNSLL